MGSKGGMAANNVQMYVIVDPGPRDRRAARSVPDRGRSGRVDRAFHDIDDGGQPIRRVQRGGFAGQQDVAQGAQHRRQVGEQLLSGAAFPVVFGTSHVALWHRARLQAGETLVVHGSSGGVGLTAVAIGKQLGATVIATASGPEKLQVAREHGADHLIDTSREEIRSRIRELTDGRGADVVYDPVGGGLFDLSLRAIAWEGRIVVVGFASGIVPQIPANHLLVKNAAVLGFYWGSYRKHDPERLRAGFRELFVWHREGRIRPLVSQTLPLERAAEAIRLLGERKVLGKLVLTVP